MVRERIMKIRDLHLGHVTRSTLSLAHRASAPRTIRRRSHAHLISMAGKALWIVGFWAELTPRVGVMAGRAFQTLIALAPTLAVDQPVGWRKQRRMAVSAAQSNVPPSGMARPAELDRIRWIEAPWIKNEIVVGLRGWPSCRENFALQGGHVPCAWSVARFAGDTEQNI